MARGIPHDYPVPVRLPVGRLPDRPGVGHSQVGRPGGSRLLTVVLIGLAAILGTAPSAKGQSVQFTKLQNDRLTVVRKLMEQSVIQRFTRLPDGSQCQVMVGPRFHTLSFADKEKWMSVPWTYCRAADERAEEMPIVDPAQGNSQIGIFTSKGLALAN